MMTFVFKTLDQDTFLILKIFHVFLFSVYKSCNPCLLLLINLYLHNSIVLSLFTPLLTEFNVRHKNLNLNFKNRHLKRTTCL